MGNEVGKIVYGLVAYLVDDEKSVVSNTKGRDLTEDYVVINLETTGFSPVYNEIVEICMLKVRAGKIVDEYYTRINPQTTIEEDIVTIIEMTNEELVDEPEIKDVIDSILEFIGDDVIVDHNALFEMEFLNEVVRKCRGNFNNTIIDTLGLSQMLIERCEDFRLESVLKTFDYKVDTFENNTKSCASAISWLYLQLHEELLKQNIKTDCDLARAAKGNMNLCKHASSREILLLPKDELGLRNIQSIINGIDNQFGNGKARILGSFLREHRSGVLVGTSFGVGELYLAYSKGKSKDRIQEIQDYYDFFEICPPQEGMHLADRISCSQVNSIKDIESINEQIVELGKVCNKPVISAEFISGYDEDGWSECKNYEGIFLIDMIAMENECEFLGEDVIDIVKSNINQLEELIDRIISSNKVVE